MGQLVPSFKLKDLRGNAVTPNHFRGDKTLLLFWNTGCGFCNEMLEDLKSWEKDPPLGAPKLLVVSTGSVEENAAMGLRSTVALDPNFQLGPEFGANGTPMAVLIDKKGRIASEMAAGSAAVLRLAGASQAEAAVAG
jgi:thiol-disulfide isomerase/thioredoxin